MATNLDDFIWKKSDEQVEHQRQGQGESHEIEEGALDVGPHVPWLQSQQVENYPVSSQEKTNTVATSRT